MIRVHIPEYNTYVSFPEGMPNEEIQKVLARNFPSKEVPKREFRTPGEDVLSLAQQVGETPTAFEVPEVKAGPRPPGWYAEEPMGIKALLPFRQQLMGEVPWRDPRTFMEAVAWTPGPTALARWAKGPVKPTIEMALEAHKRAIAPALLREEIRRRAIPYKKEIRWAEDIPAEKFVPETTPYTKYEKVPIEEGVRPKFRFAEPRVVSELEEPISKIPFERPPYRFVEGEIPPKVEVSKIPYKPSGIPPFHKEMPTTPYSITTIPPWKPGEAGFIKSPLMRHIATVGIGASIGAAIDEDDRIRGAVLGGAAGLASGVTLGRIFREKPLKLIIPKELPKDLPQTAENVRYMYDLADEVLAERNKTTWKAIKNQLVKSVVDVSGNIKAGLVRQGGELGRSAVIYRDLIAGASSKAMDMIETAHGKIFDNISSKELNVLNRIIQSRRTVQIDKYKPEMKHPLGLGKTAHEDYLANIGKTEGLDAERVSFLIRRVDEYFGEMRRQLGDLRNAGLIGDETYQKLIGLEYSPREFIQHLDPPTTRIFAGKKITVPDSGLKSLDEGSLNILENNSPRLLHEVISRTQTRIARNKANQALYDLAVKIPDNGIVQDWPIKVAAKAGYEKVSVMIGGQHKTMIMPREMAEEWITYDPLVASTLAEFVSWVGGAKILKAAATGYNPAFAISNMPRDLALIWMSTDQYSSILPKAMIQQATDLATVFKDTILRKGRYKDFIREGGGMEFLAHYGKFRGKEEINKFSKMLGYIGETSEILGRLSLRERAIKNGLSPIEATWTARNYLDFSQGGSLIKAVDKAVPYLNASVQGTRSIVRAAKNNPALFSFKVAQVMALAGSLSMANRMINPEALKEVSPREKEANWIITTPFSYIDDKGEKRHLYFKIAKDQGQRVFSSVMDAIMDRYHDGKIPKEQLYESVIDFVNIVPTNLLPPTLSGLLAYVLNKNMWTNEDLWRGSKDIESEEQYYLGKTPEPFIGLGKVTGLSPEKLRGAVTEVLPLSNPFISLVGGGWATLTGRMSEDWKYKATEQIITENPVVRRVMSSTYPFEAERSEVEEIKKQEKTATFKVNRTVDDLAEKYFKSKEPSIRQELIKIVSQQPEEDQERLVKRISDLKQYRQLPDRRWWLELKYTPDPETKALIFWEKYKKASVEKKREMRAIADQLEGIASDRFLEKLISLSKKK